MAEDKIATVQATIQAPADTVWHALVDPEQIKEYMFGTDVVSDWLVGSNIVWKGEWKGKPYEDKGKILALEPPTRLQYTHFSPMTGEEDKLENYHTVTIELDGDGKQTRLTLTQDNNATHEAKEHSEQNWKAMLDGMKKMVEDRSA